MAPKGGSIAGGTLITLIGDGFNPQKSNLTINGHLCPIVSVSNSVLVCRTPQSASLSNGTVGMNIPGANLSLFSYDYDLSFTPEIFSIFPTVISSGVTTVISLIGSKFPLNFNASERNLNIRFGNRSCLVLAVSTENITCTLRRSSPQRDSSAVKPLGQFDNLSCI